MEGASSPSVLSPATPIMISKIRSPAVATLVAAVAGTCRWQDEIGRRKGAWETLVGLTNACCSNRVQARPALSGTNGCGPAHRQQLGEPHAPDEIADQGGHAVGLANLVDSDDGVGSHLGGAVGLAGSGPARVRWPGRPPRRRRGDLGAACLVDDAPRLRNSPGSTLFAYTLFSEECLRTYIYPCSHAGLGPLILTWAGSRSR